MEEIQTSEKKISRNFLDRIIIKFNKPPLAKKTNFFRLLALTQKAGLGIRDALIAIRKSETHKGMIMIIDALIAQINQGANLSKAMSTQEFMFSEEQIALVESSEVMGNLPDILEQIAVELENAEKTNSRIKKALSYPAILIAFSAIATVILLIFVVPTIVNMFPNADALPSITKFTLKASDFAKKSRYIVLILVVGAITLFNTLYKFSLPFRATIDQLFIKTPVVGDVVKAYYMYKFSNLLGQLYSAGVNPVLSLSLIANVFNNFHYKKKVLEIKRDLKAGFTSAESMEGSTLFDPILVQIIHLGEETGTISSILPKISGFYRDLLQNKIDMLMGVLEPVILAGVAAVIGTIVASIFLPMTSIMDTIQ